MAIFKRRGDAAHEAADAARMAAGGGGAVAHLTAMLALLVSIYSVYESVWKSDALRLFVAPTIAFADPSNGPFDVFEIPVTLVNDGARTGVALAFELEVAAPETDAVKRYYAAGTGAWREAYEGARTPFAPISVAGRGAVTERILFFPRAGETIERHVAVEGGTYRFRLTMRGAPPRDALAVLGGDPSPPEPTVLEFEMTIDGLDYRAFNAGGTLEFRDADYETTASD
ncbi:MAG: hypothetical protein AAFW46_11230 [Pseudomonadota bacterium]